MPIRLTDEIITAAIEGYVAQKRHLDEQIAELRGARQAGQDEIRQAEAALECRRPRRHHRRDQEALGPSPRRGQKSRAQKSRAQKSSCQKSRSGENGTRSTNR